jgi:hypothetical protein
MPATAVPDQRLESGAAISSIAAPLGTSVVLVISPDQCVSCDVDLARWLAPPRDASGAAATRISVVLTRAPTADEQRAITLLRLPVVGRLAGSTARRVKSPCVLTFEDARPVAASCGTAG